MGAPDVFLSVYAAHAAYPENTKQDFYDEMQKTLDSTCREHIRIIGGDFNAKLAKVTWETNRNFGQHILEATNEQFENMVDKTRENRHLFLNFVESNDLWACNTHFQKRPDQNCTFACAGTKIDLDTWTYDKFSQIDFVLIDQRWKNWNTNTEVDNVANVMSDHFPIWGQIKGKFAKRRKQEKTSIQMDFNVNDNQINDFNEKLSETLHNGSRTCWDGESFCMVAKQITSKVFPEKQPDIKKPWISEDTFKLICEKHHIQRRGNAEEHKQMCKRVRKATKQDWETWLGQMTDKDLDLRDKWLGIRFLKKQHSRKTYECADRFGRQVGFKDHATAAADYLEEVQWGTEEENNLFDRNEWRSTNCNQRNNGGNTSEFNLQEIREILRAMKRNKASGPDEIPMEVFKLMNDENLEVLVDIINEWWNQSTFPENLLNALVASLYKKGDPKQQKNYRPISLLNSIYKIYAAVLKKRLAEAIDEDLQKTQFGFRKGRSTSIPINCIKRIVEKAYSSQDPLFLVFLDWEKAFDRIRQDKLIECLYRMNVDEKMVKAIASLYCSPHFAVKINQTRSSWRLQKRGIRQGCPLSPYLFLVVMTVLFRDVHSEINLSRGTWDPLTYTELL